MFSPSRIYTLLTNMIYLGVTIVASVMSREQQRLHNRASSFGSQHCVFVLETTRSSLTLHEIYVTLIVDAVYCMMMLVVNEMGRYRVGDEGSDSPATCLGGNGEALSEETSTHIDPRRR